MICHIDSTWTILHTVARIPRRGYGGVVTSKFLEKAKVWQIRTMQVCFPNHVRISAIVNMLQDGGKTVESVCSYTPVYFAKMSETNHENFEQFMVSDLLGNALKQKIHQAVKERKKKQKAASESKM